MVVGPAAVVVVLFGADVVELFDDDEDEHAISATDAMSTRASDRRMGFRMGRRVMVRRTKEEVGRCR